MKIFFLILVSFGVFSSPRAEVIDSENSTKVNFFDSKCSNCSGVTLTDKWKNYSSKIFNILNNFAKQVKNSTSEFFEHGLGDFFTKYFESNYGFVPQSADHAKTREPSESIRILIKFINSMIEKFIKHKMPQRFEFSIPELSFKEAILTSSPKIVIEDDARLSSKKGVYTLFANVKINATLEINELQFHYWPLDGKAKKITITADDLLSSIGVVIDFDSKPCKTTLIKFSFLNVFDKLTMIFTDKSGVLKFLPGFLFNNVLQYSTSWIAKSALKKTIENLDCENIV